MDDSTLYAMIGEHPHPINARQMQEALEFARRQLNSSAFSHSKDAKFVVWRGLCNALAQFLNHGGTVIFRDPETPKAP